jgi:hypothetical protein
MYYIYIFNIFNIFTGKIFKVKCPTMTDPNLYLLTHPENWPHKGQLPVTRRGGNPVYRIADAGIVMENNLCRVWSGVYIGYLNPWEDYATSEKLLEDWNID